MSQALCGQAGYDPTALAQNGVATPVLPAYNRYTHSQPLSYPLHAGVGTHWPMQYVMHPPPHMTQVDVSINQSSGSIKTRQILYFGVL